jgi:hypothetical protein
VISREPAGRSSSFGWRQRSFSEEEIEHGQREHREERITSHNEDNQGCQQAWALGISLESSSDMLEKALRIHAAAERSYSDCSI